MHQRPRRALAAGSLLAAIAMLASCGAGTEVAPTATSTAPSTATPATVDTLDGVDFTAMPYVGDLVDRAGGGEVNQDRVQLLDLTGNGIDEAVVVVESGGTLGDIGVGIYRLEGGRPLLDYFAKVTGHIEVRLGLVVLQEGVYAPDDAECCPSQLRERAIGWQDGDFTQVSEQVVDNPAQ